MTEYQKFRNRVITAFPELFIEKTFEAGLAAGMEKAAEIAETRDNMGLALVGEEAAEAIRSAIKG